MKEIFEGVFENRKKIYTKNLVKNKSVYGEKLIGDMREWNPERSKLCAAILSGLKKFPLRKNSKVLYLGASTGTTVSHVSDIVSNGMIYAVEFSERVIRKLLDLQEKRKNISPIYADARKIDKYPWVEKVDLIFVDIADPQETEISIRNAKRYLKESGFLMISIKSQSIDVTLSPEKIYKRESRKISEAGFKIEQLIRLDPYEEKHAMLIARIQ